MIEDHAVQALMKEEESESYYVVEFKNGESFVGMLQKRPYIAGASKCYSLINAYKKVITFSYGDHVVRFQEV